VKFLPNVTVANKAQDKLIYMRGGYHRGCPQSSATGSFPNVAVYLMNNRAAPGRNLDVYALH